MEACGSAHHYARWLNGLGIEVLLLPAHYVRAYVKRNKTDAADAAALLEAARASDISPVRVKSVEQQALQGLHRARSLWMGTRTSRINALRGFCREFGIAIAQGSRLAVEQISRVLADPNSAVPELIRGTMKLLVEEIRLLEARIGQLERELSVLAKQSPACTILLSIPGVGLLTSTAMSAATGGSVSHYKSSRHFSSWFGLTPREHSSGNTRHLGRISKQGDRYLRMLLTHGARSVLRAATVAKAWFGVIWTQKLGPLPRLACQNATTTIFPARTGSRYGTGPLIGTDAANRDNGPCSTSRQRPVHATTAPLLPESRRGLRLAQPACSSPTMLLPLRSVLRREGLPQRRALCSGDSTQTFKNFFSGDRFSSLGLSDRLQEFRLKFSRNFKGFVRFASKNGDDGTFGQGISFHDDLSAYDSSSG